MSTSRSLTRDEALLLPGERWGWRFWLPQAPGPSALWNSPPPDPRARDYAYQYELWKSRIQADEAQQQAVYNATPWLFPYGGLLDAYPVVNVFGGSGAGWRLLLTTLGMSLLGQHRVVTVVNLSERNAADELVRTAERMGLPAQRGEVGASTTDVDLYGGLNGEQLISLLLGVLYVDHRDPSISRDRSILRRVVQTMGEPVTVTRLQAGIRAVLMDDLPGQTILPFPMIEALRGLYGRDVRERGGVIDRLLDLENRLDELALFVPPRGPTADADRDVPVPSEAVTAPTSPLSVVRVSPDLDLRDFDLAASLVLQRVVRHIRSRHSEVDARHVLIVAGADLVSERVMDSIAAAAPESNLRITLLFEHLRDKNRTALGAEGSCSVFMRLANSQEAGFAAEHIGKKHRFVLSQISTSAGGSEETHSGQESNSSVGATSGFMSSSTSETSGQGVSSGISRSTNWTTSEARERVHEFVVEPETIQSLPESALIVTGQGATPLLLDCNPDLAAHRRVSVKVTDLGAHHGLARG